MKAIAIAALVALMACPVAAKKWVAPFVGHCSDDFTEVTGIYGTLEEIEVRKSERDFGVMLLGNDVFEVLLMVPPDGAFCILWDSRLIEGDPT